jgi:integrase
MRKKPKLPITKRIQKGKPSRNWYYRERGKWFNLGTENYEAAVAKYLDIKKRKQEEALGPCFHHNVIETSKQPIEELISEYITELKSLGRKKSHYQTLETRLLTVAHECNWPNLSKIRPNDFIIWRSKYAEKKSGKTLNEYLGGFSAFLNWLISLNRIENNPLKNIKRMKKKPTRIRRAANERELRIFLNYRGRYRLVYLLALCTGLRRGAIAQLQWGDFQKNDQRYEIFIRPEIAKNEKAARLPIPSQLAKELEFTRPASAKENDRLFAEMPSEGMKTFIKDLEQMGIEYQNDQGHYLDFHSLRVSFCTFHALIGTPVKIAQELMTHADPSLTLNIYSKIQNKHLHTASENFWGKLQEVDQVDHTQTTSPPKSHPPTTEEAINRAFDIAAQEDAIQGFTENKNQDRMAA